METTEEKQQNKTNYGLVGLRVYALIMTLIVLHFMYFGRYQEDQNFLYEWNGDYTLNTIKKKNTFHILEKATDENFDNNYEKRLLYANGKGPVSDMIDKDENGIYEIVYSYDFGHRYTGIYEDKDQDGFYEYVESICENGDTIIYTDLNNNGKYEYEIKKRLIN